MQLQPELPNEYFMLLTETFFIIEITFSPLDLRELKRADAFSLALGLCTAIGS